MNIYSPIVFGRWPTDKHERKKRRQIVVSLNSHLKLADHIHVQHANLGNDLATDAKQSHSHFTHKHIYISKKRKHLHPSSASKKQQWFKPLSFPGYWVGGYSPLCKECGNEDLTSCSPCIRPCLFVQNHRALNPHRGRKEEKVRSCGEASIVSGSGPTAGNSVGLDRITLTWSDQIGS